MSSASYQQITSPTTEPSVTLAENTQILSPITSLETIDPSGTSPIIIFTVPGQVPEDVTEIKNIMSSRSWKNAHDRKRKGIEERIVRRAEGMVKTWSPNTVWLLKYDPREEGKLPVTVGYVSFTRIDKGYLKYANPSLKYHLGAKDGDYRFGIHFIEGMKGKKMFKEIVKISILLFRDALKSKDLDPPVFASCYADNTEAVRAFTSYMKERPGKDSYVSETNALFKISGP